MIYFFFLTSSIFLIFSIVLNKSTQITPTLTSIIEAWLKSLLIATLGVFASTEILSAFGILSEVYIRYCWTGIFGGLLIYCISNKTYVSLNPSPIKEKFKQLPKSYKILVGAVIGVYLLPLLSLVLLAAPNNIDSINYHLTRIISWLQFQNLYHYPTLHIQQLYHNILGEYWQLHFLSVSPSDSLVNFIQFTAMCSSALTVGLIVRHLGYKHKVQILSSILLVSLPVGIFESTSTQIDYLACFYFLVFVYFGLLYIQKLQLKDATFMMLALVFGCFTKYTIFFFALPFCIWFGVRIIMSQSLIKSGLVLGMIIAGYCIVFTPFFIRNYQLFEHPVHPPVSHVLHAENLATEKHAIKFTLGNTIKNFSLHLGLPNEQHNTAVSNLVSKFHQLLGVNVNDAQLSADKFQVRFVVTEDTVSNLYLLILIIGSLISYVWIKPSRNEVILFACMISGFLLFCSSLKFQLWSTRTHMPFFALGCVIISVAIDKISSKLLYNLTWIGLITSFPFLLLNPNKSLVSVRSVVKYVLAYPPNFLCLEEKQIPIYRKKIEDIYDFNNPMPCYKLQKQLSYWERMKLVSKLDKLGYYDGEKQSVFDLSHHEQYFKVTGEQSYRDFMAIYPHISKQEQSIAYKSGLGYYHYWASYKTLAKKSIDFHYIGYSKAFQKLENEKKAFEYTSILTNDMNWIRKNIPQDSIAYVISRPTICLVKLKKPSTNKYVSFY
ncbi:glycosyltransferase family 39 protein [Flectobacillus roseus]|uniref:glycosyltransferase family 39 protein n=1 Tax=Flectobacillus roseus TaxID=502259 RepID=UPI0024B787DF|nr:glycosyltransferase family 39 protein [Flectobacillus roseus]MDI9868303.1 glycosyltransferase family 39 protein [Flectobacillus roseus]